ncbi:MAG TPA: hypothetical protein VGR34_00575, partial [Candidatus Dormibacteraeota bacterium]|nr:hypothetical protein [Candidatus Dormibacteraeota bacterium]
GAPGAPGDPHVAGGTGEFPAGGTGAAGEPQVGAGAAESDAGPPHEGEVAAEGFAGEAAGWSQLGPAGGGTTIVGATGFVGRAKAGGAHVEATPAVWLVGDAGRTGGAAFLRLCRRRAVLR